MKCEQCVKEGKRSTITPGVSSTTLMGYTPWYYDEDGNLQTNPNPNKTTTELHCSNGHSWSVTE